MDKRTQLAIGGILFLFCIAGGYLLWRSGVQAPSYQSPSSELPGKGVVGNAESNTDAYDVVIEYTDDGFKPRDITIKRGERVRFLNTSSEGTWPASAIHPTHSLYPEKESTDCLGSSFDSCRILQNGEFFDFTFQYEGEWRFHDHVHAYQTGSITVTTSSTVEE